MTHLDDDLRAQLLRDAERGEPVAPRGGVDLEALMASRGPALVREGRRRRAATRVGALALAAMIPLGLWVYSRATSEDDAPTVASRPSAAPECAARAARAREGAVDGLRDEGFAAFEAEAGAAARVEVAGPCETRIDLSRGAIAVHARDLAGGALSVRTPVGEVTVRGTIFRVAVERGALAVEVAEGRVAVRAGGRERVVAAGERWRSGGEPTELAPEASAALDARVRSWTARAAAAVEAPTGAREGEATSGTSGREPGQPRAGASDTSEDTSEDTRAAREREVSAESPGHAGGGLARARARGGAGDAPEPTDPEQFALEAEAARRSGDLARARALYRQLGGGRGPTAEGAWIRLARLELEQGDPRAARQALARRARFGRGFFDAEARWLEVRAREAAGDLAGATREARGLVEAHPGTPQSTAAEAWLAQR